MFQVHLSTMDVTSVLEFIEYRWCRCPRICFFSSLVPQLWRTRSTTFSSAFRQMFRRCDCAKDKEVICYDQYWCGLIHCVKDVKVQSFAIPGYSSFPFCVQVCLFSATMAPEILDMTSKFMRNAVRILVKKDGHCHFASLFHCAWPGSCQHLPTFWSSFLSFLILDPSPLSVCQDELTLEGIRQFYVAIETPGELESCQFTFLWMATLTLLSRFIQVHPGSSDAVWDAKLRKEEWKVDTLCDLYETLTITQAIIYCNTRRKAGETAMGLAGGMENCGNCTKNIICAYLHVRAPTHTDRT
jgi:hypothetical protein